MTSRYKEYAFENVTGLWIAIPTPFTADGGSLDEDALRADVEHYVSALEVDGIFCGGMMGEFWALTLDERRRVHELVTDTVAGRIPVMGQTSHHTFEHTVDLTNHAADIGMDFAIVMNPYFPPNPSDEIVRAWYAALDRRTDIPVFLFNTSYSGYSISPELIDELADIPSICGIKNPKPHEHLLKVQELSGDRIVVCDAAEDDWLDLHLNHGFRALMSTPALAMFQTADSKPILEYTRLAGEGRLDEAWAVHATLAPHRQAFIRWMRDPWITNKGGEVPIAQLKRWLELMGHPQGPVRLPLIPLSPGVDDELRADVAALGLLAT